MPAVMSTLPPTPALDSDPGVGQASWFKSVLLDRGYLALMKGDAVKVYLALLSMCGGRPDQRVKVSHGQLMRRTKLSHPTVSEGLHRLERLGLVAVEGSGQGRVGTYWVCDPPLMADRPVD